MQQPFMSGRSGVLLAVVASVGLVAAGSLTTGCLKIGGNEPLLKVGGEPAPVDTSRVQVNNLDEARQELAKAYARNDYLEQRNSKLERDKHELKDDLKKVEHERDRYKKAYEKATGQD